MDSKKLLLFAGLGVGGYLLYKHYQNQQANTAAAAAAASATPAVPSTLSNPTSVPTSGVIAPPIVSIPQVPLIASTIFAAPAAASSSSGIDPTVVSVVQKWATSDGRPPVLAMMDAMVPAEYQGMYNLITNFWDAGVPPTQPEVDFWNNLRSKYDPTHQSW